MTLHHTFTLWVIYFSNFTSVRVLRNCLLLEYNYNSDVTNSHWLECLSSLGHAEFFRLRTSSTSSSFLLSDIHQAEKSYYKFYVVHLVSPPFFFTIYIQLFLKSFSVQTLFGSLLFSSLWQSNVRINRFALAHSLRVQSVVVMEPGRQEPEMETGDETGTGYRNRRWESEMGTGNRNQR